MRRHWYGLASAIALSLSGCEAIGGLVSSCPRPDEGLIFSLNQAIKTAPSRKEKTVELKTASPFPWEKVFVFSPYTSPTEVQKALGFEWKDVKCSGIESLDSIHLLVFVQGNQVVKFMDLKRDVADFAPAPALKQGISAQQAVFTVEPMKNSQWVVLKLKSLK